MKEGDFFDIGFYRQVYTDKSGTMAPIFFFQAFTESVYGIKNQQVGIFKKLYGGF